MPGFCFSTANLCATSCWWYLRLSAEDVFGPKRAGLWQHWAQFHSPHGYSKGEDSQHSQCRLWYHEITTQRCTEWHITQFYIYAACWLSRVKSKSFDPSLNGDDKSSSFQMKNSLSKDGRSISQQNTSIQIIIKRSQLKCGTLYSTCQASVAHFHHCSPQALSKTVFYVFLGTLPKARVI